MKPTCSFAGAGAALLVLSLTAGCSSTSMELVSFAGGKISGPARPAVAEPPPEAPKAVQISGSKLSIEDKIQFVTWSAEILAESHTVLDEIAAVLKENGQIKRIEIQGHTARTGQSKRAMKLSVERANAVRGYLMKQGVDATRLVARGYGDNKPIADNGSAEGRERNRRVEFVILDQEGTGQVAFARGTAKGE